MSIAAASKYGNRLISGLAAEDLASIEPYLVHIDLPLRTVLVHANKPTDEAYFIEEGLASVIARMPGGRDLEVGVAGREGMVGTHLVLGDPLSPFSVVMQLAGSGWQISAAHLMDAMSRSRALEQRLLRYVHAMAIQAGSTALANGRSTLQERLARWLLMCHDRSPDDTIPLTHEYLSIMLGVRRPGVTVALHVLEGEHYIRSERGHVVVLDRGGLIQATNGCYGMAEAEHERLLGEPAYRKELGRTSRVGSHGADPGATLRA